MTENIEGLNFISGSVKKLQVKNKFKLPHVGEYIKQN